jgi:flagellar biosynthesis protein FlhF
MPEADPTIAPLAAQIESLKGMVTDISNKIGTVSKEETSSLPSEVQGLYHQMMERDVNQDIAKEIALLTHGVSLKQSVEINTVAQQLVVDRLGEPMPIKLKKYAQTVLLFAGPTGAGKTTTLVKLAGRLALDQNLNIGLVNMDTYRVGAMEHMRIYAEIMNIPLKTAYNAKDLKEAVDEMADRDVILIDTAGRSSTDAAYRKELEEYISAAHVDEVYLVISVVTGNKVCKDIIRNYSFIQNYKLIITKLDEVGVWGNILNIADYAKKSLAYVTMGQDVPDDISQVNPAMLAQNIVGRREVTL